MAQLRIVVAGRIPRCRSRCMCGLTATCGAGSHDEPIEINELYERIAARRRRC